MTRVLVLPGAVSDGSPSVALAGAAARELALLGHQVTRLSLADYSLPILSGEPHEEPSAPHAAQQLARQLAAHDAVLIVVPEHNGGVPALLKNAIDWVSHPKAGGARAFGEDRVFALASVASDPLGGAAALAMLRQILAAGLRALVIPEQFALAGADRAFAENGALGDPQRTAELRRMLDAMARRATLLRRGIDDHQT